MNGQTHPLHFEDGSLMEWRLTDRRHREEERIHAQPVRLRRVGPSVKRREFFMGRHLKNKAAADLAQLPPGEPSGPHCGCRQDAMCAAMWAASVELPLNAKGNSMSAVPSQRAAVDGQQSLLLKEPYIGQVPLISGEIAEDIASYYAVSEQIPTVCGLGVLVETDQTIRRAGGYLIQLLPAATDSVIDEVEQCVAGAAPVTAMLDAGMSPEDICRAVLPRFHLEVLDTAAPGDVCGCSKQRVIQALISTGIDELRDMQRQESTAVECHFCDKKYLFTPADIEKIIAMAQ
jgi:molecular chaperone Hsp33